MKNQEQLLENVVIYKTGQDVFIKTRHEHKIDGCITGSIINIILAPLLFAGIVIGFWMIILVIRKEAPWFLTLMGAMFVAFSIVPLYLLLWSQPAFFPYECRFRRHGNGHWLIKRKLAFFAERWCLLPDFNVASYPTHKRGDWGYGLSLQAGRKKLMLTPPGVFTSSKEEAKNIADRDSQIVASYLGVKSRLEKWE